jgi:hypothetical protein
MADVNIVHEIINAGSKPDKTIVDEILIDAKQNELYSRILLREITEEEAIFRMDIFMKSLGY